LALSTASSYFLELPWYLSNLAAYHGEFLAGVLAFMARPRLAGFRSRSVAPPFGIS
jgi:hypothetical protein